MPDYIDLVAVLIGSGALLPPVHDALVSWDASKRFKSVASLVLAAVTAVAVYWFNERGIEWDTSTVFELFAAAFVGKEVGYRGLQKPLAEGTAKPTPLATLPYRGLGSPSAGSVSGAADVYQGD